MNTYTDPTSMRLRIWQQNLNKSNKAQYDLINSPIHNDWDIVLLQEPYINSLGNTKANHHWRVIYPSSNLSDTSMKQSVILVNTKLDMNSWAQVRFKGTNDIMVIQIKYTQGRVTIFNIYNDCNHSDILVAMDKYLTGESVKD